MKIIAQVKLTPTKEQAKALRQTLELTNKACNRISELAWKLQTFKHYPLHLKIYKQIRQEFDLSAQVVVRAIAKVTDAYKRDTKVFRKFKPMGAIAYDDRILTWRVEYQFVTIWTVAGRQKVPYACGDRQKELLPYRQGESDLVYHRGNFFLLAVCDLPNPTERDVEDVLGVDFGIVNIATDSDGHTYSGKRLEQKRQWYQKRRSVLQQVGTRSAHRKLQQMSGKQSRHQKNENHRIAKQIAQHAERTNRAVAIEELSGIRQRARANQAQRERLHNWPFRQLREFVAYKLVMRGIPLIPVDSRYTSQTCSECGQCEKANRRSQSEFVCKSCGHTQHADINAAINIRSRALVNKPMVSEPQVAFAT